MRVIADWLRDNGIDVRIDARASDFVVDSRQVSPGAVFAALPGAQTDGAHFVSDAAARGAVAVLVERPIEAAVPVVVVPDLRARIGRLAASFFGEPSRAMRMVGVTGTNGKTTTTHLLERIVTGAGRKAGLIGTIAYRFGGIEIEAPNTTPDAATLQRLLGQMRDAGVDTAVMEVSSHGLAEGRVDDVAFDVGVFTNLTGDHLDYHGDMEAYFTAKTRLFAALLPASPKVVRAVVNIDDPFGARLAQSLRVAKWSVGRKNADFVFEAPKLRPDGFEAVLSSPFGTHRIECRMPGLHNVYNAVEALAAGAAVGLEFDAARRALAEVPGVAGRLEHFSADGVHVYVDYAHSDDALANVLAALRPAAGKRIVTVFGCGGDRDKAKRPRMGRVAAQASDVVVLTSDNPRTEDAAAILADIETGVRPVLQGFDGRLGYRVIADRQAAITWAVAQAEPGDLVLVAGKGHETYQIIGREKRPFDDRAEVRRALASRGQPW